MSIAIEFRDVDILFGARSRDARAKALRMLDEGRTRTEISDAAGVLVGVAGASLAVERGEISVLMGLSGSGKSSLLRVANGLNRADRGSVLVGNGLASVDITRCGPDELRTMRRQRLAMVFQQFALLPWRTVRENVGLGFELSHMPARQRAEIVDEKLKLVGLDRWADSYASQLSGGMQQRVGLARAFATEADILLMDEPFSALDPLIRSRLQDELLDLQARARKTILFVSHDVDEALKLGTHISIMRDGRIVQTGTQDDIILNPADSYVSDFVGHMNPLSVLRAATVMKAVVDLVPGPDDHVWIDTQRNYRLRLDGQGCASTVKHGPQDIPLTILDEVRPDQTSPTGIVGVPRTTLLCHVIRLRQTTGHPVLVTDNGCVAGVCDDSEILAALSGSKRLAPPAIQPVGHRAPERVNRVVGLP